MEDPDFLDTAGCDNADPARLLPTFGPFLFGPDPGPCGDSNGIVYEYSGTVATGSTGALESTYTRDEAGRIVAIDQAGETITYVYENGSIEWLDPFSDEQIAMGLDERGYPQTLQIGVAGAIRAFFTYQYEECHVVTRTSLGDSPGYVSSSFNYDEEGRVTSRTDADVSVHFDYDCW